MQIINHGDSYKETTCPICKCHFAYTAEDVKSNSGYGKTDVWIRKGEYDYGRPFYFQEKYMSCPECKTKLYLARRRRIKLDKSYNDFLGWNSSEWEIFYPDSKVEGILLPEHEPAKPDVHITDDDVKWACRKYGLVI